MSEMRDENIKIKYNTIEFEIVDKWRSHIDPDDEFVIIKAGSAHIMLIRCTNVPNDSWRPAERSYPEELMARIEALTSKG